MAKDEYRFSLEAMVLGKQTFYYYTQFSRLRARRTLLKKENITLLCENDKVYHAPEWIKEFQ